MEEVKIKDTKKDKILKIVLSNISIINQTEMLHSMHKQLQCDCQHIALNIKNADIDKIDFKKCLLCGRSLKYNDLIIKDFYVKLHNLSVEEEYLKQVLEFKEILKNEFDLDSAITAYEWKLRDYNNARILRRKFNID